MKPEKKANIPELSVGIMTGLTRCLPFSHPV